MATLCNIAMCVLILIAFITFLFVLLLGARIIDRAAPIILISCGLAFLLYKIGDWLEK